MAVSKKPLKGRKVRCRETGEYGTTLTFYKAPDGHYYKDEQTYLKHEHKSEAHRKLIDEISGYMGYIPGMVFPTCVTQSLKEFSFYGDDIVLETLERNRDSVEHAMRTKTFDGDMQRARYLMAIIRNHINDVYMESQKRQRSQIQEPAENSIPEVSTEFEMQNIGCAVKGKDISDFLDLDLD